MAPRKGAASPVLTVRIPADVYNVIKAAAALQNVTTTSIVREAICACFAGLLDREGLTRELQRRQDQLGRGEGA